LYHSSEHAFGQDQYFSIDIGYFFKANMVPDTRANPAAVLKRDAVCTGPRGDPAGLK
jgi:hypothetical protein